NIAKADRNRYNLEVFLSIAELTGHHNRLIFGMKSIEEKLKAARAAAEKNDPQQAVGRLVAAYEQARGMVEERYKTFRRLKTTWEKSRLPKGQDANGKKLYHPPDNTKVHQPP